MKDRHDTPDKRIVLACYGVPGRAGAGTVSYLLFETMQRDGLDVALVNLVGQNDEAGLRNLFCDRFGNPRKLDNVYTCVLDHPLWGRQPGLSDLISSLEPGLLLGFGFIPAWLMERAAPRRPVIFMTAGSRHLQHLVETGAVKDFMAFRRGVAAGITYPVPADNRERQALEGCELLLVHSPLVRFAFDHFFPEHAGKVYSNVVSVADLIYVEAGQFAALSRPFHDRDIDVLFVASSWSRPEKNFSLVRRIISGCKELTVHVVGDVDRPWRGAQYHGAITQRDNLYALLGRSRTVVSASLVDAAPGILFEASAMGCNVIASRNCGNWPLCHAQLLVERYTPREFIDKIHTARSHLYEDNRDLFRGGYADLLETLRVFCP